MNYFGWTLSDIRDGPLAQAICGLLKENDALVGPLQHVDRRSKRTPLTSMTVDDFQALLRQPGKLDPEMGGLALAQPDERFAVHLRWSQAAEMPFSTMWGVAGEELFDEEGFSSAFAGFLKAMAGITHPEYLLAIHASDEDSKRRLPRDVEAKIRNGERGNVPSYAAKPARYLPCIPWLMIFGQRYVDFFGRDRLDVLGCHAKEWLSSGACLITTSASPLQYGTKEVREREAAILVGLGQEAFFDPSNPYRIAAGPEYPVALKKWVADPEESWIQKPGQVWDASIRDGKLEVTERRHGQ